MSRFHATILAVLALAQVAALDAREHALAVAFRAHCSFAVATALVGQIGLYFDVAYQLELVREGL